MRRMRIELTSPKHSVEEDSPLSSHFSINICSFRAATVVRFLYRILFVESIEN